MRDTYRIRPYPARISGEPVKFEVLSEPDLTLSLAWKHEPKLGATRVFAPKKSIFRIDVYAQTEDDVACAYEYDERHIRCTSEVAGNKRVSFRRCMPNETCLKTLPPDPPPMLPDAGTVDGSPRDAGHPQMNDRDAAPREPSQDAPTKKSSGCSVNQRFASGTVSFALALPLAGVTTLRRRTSVRLFRG